MIRRLYAHNFRCFQNFTLDLGGLSSALVIGNNGTGKTTISLVLEMLQLIGAGRTRVADIVSPSDFSFSGAAVPMRFELEVEIGGDLFVYGIAFEYPKDFREMRVAEESLSCGGVAVFDRDRSRVRLSGTSRTREVIFSLDWHSVALPLIQQPTGEDSIGRFQQWLSRILILGPIPQQITGDSKDEVLQPNPDVDNFGDWFSGVLAQHPAAYRVIDEYLRPLMPDLQAIRNPSTGRETRTLVVQFREGERELQLPFEELSDGEKCLMIGAMVLATRDGNPNLFCFWDEPDNHLSLSEVSQFVLSLRRDFGAGGQFLATSHNPEAIRAFSNENTFVLQRRSHVEPTIVRRLADLNVPGDLVAALIRGDVGS
ncbi:MAG: AAA family ATPase [Bryobacteraceae bacterium]|nr:AAA family ATPase [Bryobacteraceae bacterium]